MDKWIDKLYTKLEAKEKTLAREQEKGYNTNDTENAIRDEKKEMLDKIFKKGKQIDTKYKTLKAKGKLDEARALSKDAALLKKYATELNSSRGGKTRRVKGGSKKNTRKNGF